MQLSNMYQEVILDHYKSPRGKGLKDPFDGQAHHVNPTCGDEITVQVKLSSDRKNIESISYDGQGCSISQASASIMFEQVNKKSVEEFNQINDDFLKMMQGKGNYQGNEDLIGDGVSMIGVAQYPARVKCALLSWMAAKDAIIRAQGDVNGG
ncbi:MAG: Fe-S cluster assembly sulfur transfer protein SufU [Candidatus Nanopelagicales bacterium]|jgi:nitrogen fixation NifU-like protein